MDLALEKIVDNWAGWASERVGVKQNMDKSYIKTAIIEAMKDVSNHQAQVAKV